jgi:hypothetical protein
MIKLIDEVVNERLDDGELDRRFEAVKDAGPA